MWENAVENAEVAERTGDVEYKILPEVTAENGNYKKVQSKLYTTSENISKLSVIHIDEIVEVSKENSPYYTQGEKKYQWLDENGWLHRTAMVQNVKNGKLYQITLDIAKAKDGRIILYAVDGNIKNLGRAQIEFNASQGSKGSELKSQDHESMIAQKNNEVKGVSKKSSNCKIPNIYPQSKTAIWERCIIIRKNHAQYGIFGIVYIKRRLSLHIWGR